MTSAATIYRNASVFTGDADLAPRESVAVREGRVIAVGDLDAVRLAAGSDAEEVDLGGAFVSPGLIEGHSHMLMLGESLDKVQLRDAGSIEEVQR
ncbi:hypothetical protein BMH30_12795, partial [Leucobacter sp. OLES1]